MLLVEYLWTRLTTHDSNAHNDIIITDNPFRNDSFKFETYISLIYVKKQLQCL